MGSYARMRFDNSMKNAHSTYCAMKRSVSRWTICRDPEADSETRVETVQEERINQTALPTVIAPSARTFFPKGNIKAALGNQSVADRAIPRAFFHSKRFHTIYGSVSRISTRRNDPSIVPYVRHR